MASQDRGRIDLLGLGMSILDSVQVLDQFPSDAGVTRVSNSVLMGGGPVPTALCAAARLGARAAIMDRVGNDWRGDRIVEDYRKFGVDTRYLLKEEGRTSSFGTVLVRKSDGERHLLFEEGDFTPLEFPELPREALTSCRVLHLNGRHWPACLEAARLVRESGGLVSFDGGAHRFDPKLLELLPLVDILIVAAEFADQAVGPGDRNAQLDRLAQWGANLVGITEGSKGSWFRAADGARFHQAAFPVAEVIDTTGCGDVFHGAFLSALRLDSSWKACARFASAAAAISATQLGGRGYLPGLEEVETLLNLPVACTADLM